MSGHSQVQLHVYTTIDCIYRLSNIMLNREQRIGENRYHTVR